MNISNRKGRFTLSFEVIRDIADDSIPFQSLFKDFVIFRAEARYMDNWIDYEAYSELFDEVAENEVVPLYKLTIETDVATKLYSISVRQADARTPSLQTL